jgi:hypothetical protein
MFTYTEGKLSPLAKKINRCVNTVIILEQCQKLLLLWEGHKARVARFFLVQHAKTGKNTK